MVFFLSFLGVSSGKCEAKFVSATLSSALAISHRLFAYQSTAKSDSLVSQSAASQ